MKRKRLMICLAMISLLAAFVAAQTQESNPVENYFTTKLLPFIQWLGTAAGIVFIIWGAINLQTGEPEKADKGKKMIIGSIIGVALVWLAPALVNWLKP